MSLNFDKFEFIVSMPSLVFIKTVLVLYKI